MSFILDPRFIDIILILVAFEAIGVLALRQMRGVGPAPLAFLFNLASGSGLLFALRNALAGASTVMIAGGLVFALAAHLAELQLRWNTGRARGAQATIGKQTAMAQARPNAAPRAPARGSRVRA